ncbi:Histone-lysine N-methyltransferase, H3 lysine-79 specific [Araneus ventricosus]|uniref:Histone-lysine N-methyltransferase, H3 lysine-79 specific n=1 Tax=Araneus ventricosus TaxID=182803 RepID=A0A4Y2AK40_ARAVE|nr:Histone-lysine N-methyltransferase, H3 lysine-79 specific [Araneus ventricosus]
MVYPVQDQRKEKVELPQARASKLRCNIIRKKPAKRNCLSNDGMLKSQRKLRRSERKRGPGRPKKNTSKNKRNKPLKFSGLDLLHAKTILSTSISGHSDPAPGCIDQKLNNTTPVVQTPVEENTVAIERFLFVQKRLMLDFISFMKSGGYRSQLQREIAKEKERSKKLKSYFLHLQKVISGLREEGVSLLKDRVSVLGYSINHSSDLLFKVKESIRHYMKFKSEVGKLTTEISELELEYKKLKGPGLQKLNETELRNQIHKEIITYKRTYQLSQKKAILPGDKNSLKMTFRDISPSSIKDSKSIQLDLLAPKMQRIQDSMIIPNFQDRIKTIIASALKESSTVECDVTSDKAEKKYPCKDITSPLGTSRRSGISEVFTTTDSKSPERQIDSAMTKHALDIPDKTERINFLAISNGESKGNKNVFKQVELSDPEVSSSFTNTAYSPISPTRTPPSNSPMFQVHEGPMKAVLDRYSVSLGSTINKNVHPQEYNIKSRMSDPTVNVSECSSFVSQASKNDSSDNHLKGKTKSVKLSFPHLIDSKSKKGIEELKAKNGFPASSRSHSYSHPHRDEQYERKLKSKHQVHSDAKERRIKERLGSFKLPHDGKLNSKEASTFSKTDKNLNHKMESKHRSKHSLPSSGKSNSVTKDRSSLSSQSHNQKWQAKVSSGFDKLLALAATQLNHVNREYKCNQGKGMKEDISKSNQFSLYSKSNGFVIGDQCKTNKDTNISQKNSYSDHSRLSQAETYKPTGTKTSNINRSRKGPRTPPDTPPRTPSVSPDRRVLESPYFQSHSPISSVESVSSNRSSLSPPYISPARGSSKDRSRSTSPYSSRASSAERHSEKYSSRNSKNSSHEDDSHEKKCSSKRRWQFKNRSDFNQRAWTKEQESSRPKVVQAHDKGKNESTNSEKSSVLSTTQTRDVMRQLDFMSQQTKDVLAHAPNGYSVVMTPSPLHAIYVPTAGVCNQPPIPPQAQNLASKSSNYSVANACGPALSTNPILNFTIPPPNFSMPPPHPTSSSVNIPQILSSQQQVQPIQLPDVTVPPPNMISVTSFLPSSNLPSCPPQLEPAVPNNHVYRQNGQSHPPPLPPTVAAASSFNNIVQSQIYRANQKPISNGTASHQLDYRVPQHCTLPGTGSSNYYPAQAHFMA